MCWNCVVRGVMARDRLHLGTGYAEDNGLQQHESVERTAIERQKTAAKKEGQRRERLARQERARPLKNEKPEPGMEQKMTRKLPRYEQ